MIRKLMAAIACLFTGGKGGDDVQPASGSGDAGDKEEWVRELVWLPADAPENSFDCEVLDCRTVALRFTAGTFDKSIVESFNRLRADDGKGCIGTLPEDSFTVESDLRFPYNGTREDGVIFFAKKMEDKWDFYAYDSLLYIRRSWTGCLLHVVELRYTDSEVIVEKIHSNRQSVYGDPVFAREHVRFLIATHFGSTQLPFPIPPGIQQSATRDIALMGFNRYGRRAQFARQMEKHSLQSSDAG
ncbi:hypothetical protein HNR46_003512 [Haloferula luteola]|uniref:Uncharacterized protein n=1 Tax=Haloferula luteola TaxID=595692 RepID=A0A840V4Q5_9BACT|nr:hypothetical protein [Haloferula luteola]MBB5353257.1 hypothetical protein [Haloferula luteola]